MWCALDENNRDGNNRRDKEKETNEEEIKFTEIEKLYLFYDRLKYLTARYYMEPTFECTTVSSDDIIRDAIEQIREMKKQQKMAIEIAKESVKRVRELLLISICLPLKKRLLKKRSCLKRSKWVQKPSCW